MPTKKNPEFDLPELLHHWGARAGAKAFHFFQCIATVGSGLSHFYIEFVFDVLLNLVATSQHAGDVGA